MTRYKVEFVKPGEGEIREMSWPAACAEKAYWELLGRPVRIVPIEIYGEEATGS